jgi:ribosomal protein L19
MRKIKKTFMFSKTIYSFRIPFLITEERYKRWLSPAVGDLVVSKTFERVTAKFTFFKLYSAYGLCIARKRSGITSYFTIRNSFNKNSIETRFFLYSPLLARVICFDAKRSRYNLAKLYYLNNKKIAKSRFRVEAYLR